MTKDAIALCAEAALRGTLFRLRACDYYFSCRAQS